MKIGTWNIRGCNHPRKTRTLARKIKEEKPYILFLQETKCSFESIQKIGQNIWKGSQVMPVEADGMQGGIAILWRDREVDLTGWRAVHFSLSVDFHIRGSEIRGTIVNIYGSSVFPQKQEFVNHLRWINASASLGNWIIGGDFNLITLLKEKKGGKRMLDKYQEDFRETLVNSSLVDLETGDGWFTWNNRRGGECLVASRLDHFLVTKSMIRGVG